MYSIKELDQPVIKAANAVRDFLIELAEDDSLPLDISELSTRTFSDLIMQNMIGFNPSNNPLDMPVAHNLFHGTPIRKMMSGYGLLETYPEFFHVEKTGSDECAFCGRNGVIVHSCIGIRKDLKNCFFDTGFVYEKVVQDGKIVDIKIVSILLNMKRTTVDEYNKNTR